MDDTTTVDEDAMFENVSLIDPQPADDSPDVTANTDTPSAEGAEAAATDDSQTPDANTTEATEDPTEETPASDTPGEENQETSQPAQTPEEKSQAARLAWQERQRTKNAVAQQLDQVYGPKTEDELIDEGLDPAQAQIEALRQEMQYERQKTQIAELNAGMQAEAVNVINDHKVFNPNSPEYDEDFAKEVEEEYKIAARLQTDENGIIVNAEFPLYDFYARKAASYSRAIERGQQRGQQEVQQMLSRTENPGGSSSTSGHAPGSLEELEERLGNAVIT